jgi:hypothetical protein
MRNRPRRESSPREAVRDRRSPARGELSGESELMELKMYERPRMSQEHCVTQITPEWLMEPTGSRATAPL